MWPQVLLPPKGFFNLFFQGIVWIDQSTFDVVRLQTDLLSPVPSVDLLRMTTDLRFRSVRIKGTTPISGCPFKSSFAQNNGRAF
jgi:hypothetical protein